MSVLGHRARNHPQQVSMRGPLDDVDTRLTPRKLWIQLHHEFGFTLDAAASSENAKLPDFFSLERCGLTTSWSGHRVWCNPPFSNLEAWLEKAWAEHRAGCPLIVMLLPANRTEQPAWQRLVESHRDGRGPIETRFIKQRVEFGGASGRAPFGCVLLIWREA